MRIKKTLCKMVVAGVLGGIMSFAPNVVDVPPIISGISVAHAQEDDAYMQKIDECTQLLIQKKYNDVVNICNDLIQSNPNRWNAYERRGFAYKDMRQFDKALEDVNKAIELAPDEYTSYWTKIAVCEGMNKPDEVRKCNEQLIEIYTRLISKDSNYSEYYTARAVIYKNLNEYQKAIADYKVSVTLPHTVPEVMKAFGTTENSMIAGDYFMCGMIYKKIKDYANAIEMYTKAIELDPDHSLYWHLRGQCYEALGEKDKAKADYVEYEIRLKGGN